MRNALAVLPRDVTEVVIACGDTPLLTPAEILGVAEARAAANAPLALAAFVADDPTGYGRVACNDEGKVLSVIEERDATSSMLASTPLIEPGWTRRSRHSPPLRQAERSISLT
jgi:bifunctional UDP-N-acetylglucosamine pyrophosphorylase/glucosamine-1-phosphate N-acetyltransferase